MIGKLRGIVDETSEDSAIIDVNGVGYVVFCSTRTLSNLEHGAAAELVIETHVREDHIHLYGFGSVSEREWFRLLTSVQGVGAKMGQAILGTLDTETLLRVIGAQDKTGLTRVSGVGPKLAERIITELKSKVAKMGVLPMPANTGALPAAKGKAAPAANINTPEGRVMEDAISALTNLGYNRTDAFSAVSKVLHSEGQDARLDTVIRLGLKELSA